MYVIKKKRIQEDSEVRLCPPKADVSRRIRACFISTLIKPNLIINKCQMLQPAYRKMREEIRENGALKKKICLSWIWR